MWAQMFTTVLAEETWMLSYWYSYWSTERNEALSCATPLLDITATVLKERSHLQKGYRFDGSIGRRCPEMPSSPEWTWSAEQIRSVLVGEGQMGCEDGMRYDKHGYPFWGENNVQKLLVVTHICHISQPAGVHSLKEWIVHMIAPMEQVFKPMSELISRLHKGCLQISQRQQSLWSPG